MGEIVNGRYRIERELGRGGMSVVYLARDERLSRQVAVKVLHPHLAAREDSRRRFLQEATAIARLEHPSILKIYDYATPQDERSYIVSQYVRGVTLKQWCEARMPLPCELVALVTQPIFEALAHAHENQIIHRDVKPENIMICAQGGEPILMDFGIAHIIDAETLTATGAVIGSPAHMAPEVVNGDELTASADLFSMGTVLYWMTCGALPFVAPNPAALFRKLLEARFDPVLERRPETLGAFARLIERCMRRQPHERPSSAGAVATELRALLTEAGLGDIKAELNALSEDVELYRAALPQRLTRAYVESARAHLAASDLSSAVDRLRRALALDPGCAEAEALIAHISAGSRGRARWVAAGGSAAALCVGAVAWSVLSAPAPLSAPLAPQVERAGGAREGALGGAGGAVGGAGSAVGGAGGALGGAGGVVGGAGVGVAVGPSGAVSAGGGGLRGEGAAGAAGEAVGGAVGEAVGASVGATGGASGAQAGRRARLKGARTLGALRKRGRREVVSEPADLVRAYQARGATPPKPSPVTSSDAPTQRVHVNSLYKGASVWVNQRNMGRVFELERTDGLALPTGQTYELTFRLPFCEDQVERLALERPLKRPLRLVFECAFKPGVLEVVGRPGAEIYLRGPTPLRLGVTNQEIRYKMSRHKQALSLLVVAEGQPDQPISVTLTAGQRAEVRLP